MELVSPQRCINWQLKFIVICKLYLLWNIVWSCDINSKLFLYCIRTQLFFKLRPLVTTLPKTFFQFHLGFKKFWCYQSGIHIAGVCNESCSKHFPGLLRNAFSVETIYVVYLPHNLQVKPAGLLLIVLLNCLCFRRVPKGD